MPRERTLILVKPNSTQKNHIGAILSRFETRGLSVAAARFVQMNRALAEGFYAEHRGKPYFDPLVTFMISAPVMAVVLEGENAVKLAREIMGKTDPAQAAEGTIRRDFGETVTINAVHGSDCPASVAREIPFFFTDDEILSRMRA